MGYRCERNAVQKLLDYWKESYLIYAPRLMRGEGTFSETDIVRYGEIDDVDEIEWTRKSDYSFKEVLLPISQTLFYYTENQAIEADIERKKGAVILLRSCDLNALTRLDEIYLKNGAEDLYYKRLRENAKFVLMGCKDSFENCFCISMNSNVSDQYHIAVNKRDTGYEIDCHWEDCNNYLERLGCEKAEVTADTVNRNEIAVSIPEELSLSVIKSKVWDEYDSRCTNCGRCNFVCPTCTCFTMQDIFYTENGKSGERRRVYASCMVDGFTNVAGGGEYRKANKERMRFKVLHKVYDYKQRNGYHMCVGCGRCDDVCPEYISFSSCIHKLEDAVKEVTNYVTK